MIYIFLSMAVRACLSTAILLVFWKITTCGWRTSAFFGDFRQPGEAVVGELPHFPAIFANQAEYLAPMGLFPQLRANGSQGA